MKDDGKKIRYKQSYIVGEDGMTYALNMAYPQQIEENDLEERLNLNVRPEGEDQIAWMIRNEIPLVTSTTPKVEKDIIRWAVEKGKRIEEKHPIIWALEKSIKIENKDPLIWAIDNNKTIENINPIKWCIDKGKRINNLSAVIWSILNNKPIEGKHPVEWALAQEHHKYTFEVQEAIKIAAEKGERFMNQDPIEFAINNKLSINSNHPIAWLLERYYMRHRYSRINQINIPKIDGVDPMIWAYKKDIKIKGIDPLTWGVMNLTSKEYKFTIDGKNPMVWAVENNKDINRKHPVVWAYKNIFEHTYGKDPLIYLIELEKRIENKHPLNWMINYIHTNNITEDSKQRYLQKAVTWMCENDKLIDDKNPIIWAIENEVRFEGAPALIWAVNNSKLINDQDPIEWALANNYDIPKELEIFDKIRKEVILNAKDEENISNYNIKIQGKTLLEWMIEKNISIEGKEPLQWVVEKDLMIHEKNPIAWALENNKSINGQSPLQWAVENEKQIENKDPIVWAFHKNKKIDNKNPINWVIENEKQIENKDPIVWALNKDTWIDNKNPINWAIENEKQIENKDPIVWALNKNKRIDNKNPINWAIENKKQIQNKNPIVWAIENNHLIDGQKPLLFLIKYKNIQILENDILDKCAEKRVDILTEIAEEYSSLKATDYEEKGSYLRKLTSCYQQIVGHNNSIVLNNSSALGRMLLSNDPKAIARLIEKEISHTSKADIKDLSYEKIMTHCSLELIDKICEVGEVLSKRQGGVMQSITDKINAFVNKVKVLLGIGHGVKDEELAAAVKDLASLATRETQVHTSENKNAGIVEQKVKSFVEKVSSSKQIDSKEKGENQSQVSKLEASSVSMGHNL